MNWVRHSGSTTFKTKSRYCRVARQGLPCYSTVARLGFKCRATVVLKSNLIRSTEFGTAVARRLKRALDFYAKMLIIGIVDRIKINSQSCWSHTFCKLNVWLTSVSFINLHRQHVMSFIQWWCERGSKSHVAKEISGRGPRRSGDEKGNQGVGDFRFINILQIFSIYYYYFLSFFSILVLPSTFTHTGPRPTTSSHYPRPTTFSYTPAPRPMGLWK